MLDRHQIRMMDGSESLTFTCLIGQMTRMWRLGNLKNTFCLEPTVLICCVDSQKATFSQESTFASKESDVHEHGTWDD